MLSLSTLLAIIVALSVLATLPMAAQCDTSYYEKYYSARRFLPLKRNALMPFNFTVKFGNTHETLENFERIALVGDQRQLGNWNAQNAVILNRTQEFNVWSATVQLPANTTVNYRYFIAAIDKKTKNVHIRRWESHIEARQFNVTALDGNRTDEFGFITQKREVQRGWLNVGRIIQFKVFRNPIKIDEPHGGGNSSGNGTTNGRKQQLLLKLQPIDPSTLTPILPSARAYTEYVRMSYGNSHLRAQPEFGVPYREDDTLMFHITVSEMQSVAYNLRLYALDEDSDLVRFIGYQNIFADSLKATEANLTIDLISPTWMVTIGHIRLQYLLMTPMPNATADFRTTFVDYWRSNWTALEAGHRGLGKSLKQTTNSPPIVENTVASMKAAGELGADIVEFDVQLTSDLVPIIYHDYSVKVCMDPKTPTSNDDLTEVFIKDVTYEQLKNLKTYQVVGTKIVEYPAHNIVEDEDQRLFPTFADFLLKINKTIGFDIEIKWPQLRSNGVYESLQTIDKNVYVDRILDVMEEHGCGRFSFFTSFDVDICMMLRFKQNMYPVMLLMSGAEKVFADPRTDTIYEAVNTAQAFDFIGIAPNAVFIQNDRLWVEVAHKQNKKIIIWGDGLKNDQTIAWFKATGVEVVIYDRMDLWLPSDKQNAFELEADLPEFFQKQCSPKSGHKTNSTVDSILSNVNLL